MHSAHHTTRTTTLLTASIAAIVCSSTLASAPDRDAIDAVQDTVDALRLQLELPVEVTAELVPENALLVSVQPVAGTERFVMSFQKSFFEGLGEDDVRTIVAHELGHVWIFTHHPYLQTERGANTVALRLVSRDKLERVYARVFANRGVKGDLTKFLPPH